MNDIFEKVKGQLNIADVVTTFGVKLDRNDKGLCPFHKEKTPSFSIKRDDNIFKCFGCGASGDVIEFVAKIKNIEELEAAKLLAEMYHIDISENNNSKKESIKEYILCAIKNIDKIDYFEKRGLNKDTIKTFKLGYDEKYKAVVIPYNSKLTYYQTRSIEGKSFFKPKTEDAGSEPLFNPEGIKSNKPVFIVESPICAMSIMQLGGVAIAICGTSGWRKLITELNYLKDKKAMPSFILSLDNDDPGIKASQNLEDELKKIGVKFTRYNVSGECKDPNELLMKDNQKLKENIELAKNSFRKKYLGDKDSFDAEELYEECLVPVQWVIEGLLPTGLAMLCAPSKFGKSWMVLQMCLSIANNLSFLGFRSTGCECLYYALEDGKARLQDRLKKMLKDSKPSKKIHFVIKADTIETGLLEKIHEEITNFPNIKLVIIDTLQKVRGKMNKNDTLYSNEYREMAKIKEFADKNKICILLVHHLRKMIDDSDIYNMISGSTALMGAADTIIILSKKKRNDVQATLSATGRDIKALEIVVSFNKSNYKWQVDGTIEEIEQRKELEEYESNIYVQTIKELIKRNPLIGWSGSASDLMKAVYDVTGKTVADTTQSVGKQISKFEYKLYCDDISHSVSKSNNRKHTFKNVIHNNFLGYQKTIF